MPARVRVSGGVAATKRSAALLETVKLGEQFAFVCGHGHVRLRKELLQVLVLVREDAAVMLVCVWHAPPIIQDNGKEAAAMVLN